MRYTNAMVENSNVSDYDFAQKVCEELKSGNREAIVEVHLRFNNRFSTFVRSRISGYFSYTHDIDDILNTFWIELLNGKAICNYLGKNKASFYGFLLKILNWRIQDWLRTKSKDNEVLVFEEGENEIDRHKTTNLTADNTTHHGNDIPNDSSLLQPSAEKRLCQIECQKLFNLSLLEFQKSHPADACLVYLRLKGMSYKMMAKKTGKKENAVKKQFTRNRTGSIAKFKPFLERNMAKRDINIKELIESLK